MSREPERITHLYRGAPIVRSWSKNQKTVREWTLCGIKRQLAGGAARERAGATEDPDAVTCVHCLQLMRPAGAIRAAGMAAKAK